MCSNVGCMHATQFPRGGRKDVSRFGVAVGALLLPLVYASKLIAFTQYTQEHEQHFHHHGNYNNESNITAAIGTPHRNIVQ